MALQAQRTTDSESGEKPKTTDHIDNLHKYLPEYGKKWWSIPHLLKLNSLLLIVSSTSLYTRYDGSLLNAFQPMPDWMAAMGIPSGAFLGAMCNGVTFGVLLSTTVAAPHLYGRRHAITIGNIIMVIGTNTQSCAGDWSTVAHGHEHASKRTYAMLLVARIILGFANGLSTCSSPPLISELSYPSHRRALTAFFNSNWYLGAIISSWVSFCTRNVGSNWSWRIPLIIQGFFPLVQGILIYLVSESPLFLISKGRNEEARAILMKYHSGDEEAKAAALIDFECLKLN